MSRASSSAGCYWGPFPSPAGGSHDNTGGRSRALAAGSGGGVKNKGPETVPDPRFYFSTKHIKMYAVGSTLLNCMRMPVTTCYGHLRRMRLGLGLGLEPIPVPRGQATVTPAAVAGPSPKKMAAELTKAAEFSTVSGPSQREATAGLTKAAELPMAVSGPSPREAAAELTEAAKLTEAAELPVAVSGPSPREAAAMAVGDGGRRWWWTAVPRRVK